MTTLAMEPWPDMLGIGLLAIGAFVQIIFWSRWILPGINGYRQPSVTIDVWMPLVLVIPMLGVVRWINYDVGTETQALTTVPIVLAALGLGATLASGRWDLKGPLLVTRRYIGLVWPLTGIFLLMLAAAHELNIWIGQSIFAIAAALPI